MKIFKKVVSISLTASMMIGTVSVVPGTVYAEESAVVLKYDGFSAYKTHQSVEEYAAGATIEIDGNKNKVLQIALGNDKSEINWNAGIPLTSYTVSYDLFLTDKKTDMVIFGVKDKNNVSYDLCGNNRAWDNKNLSTYFPESKWVSVTLSINTDTNRYSVSVGGKNILSEYVLPVNSVDISALYSSFKSENSGAVVKIDNFMINSGLTKGSNYPSESYNSETDTTVKDEKKMRQPESAEYFYEDFDNIYVPLETMLNYKGTHREFQRVLKSDSNSMNVCTEETGNKYLECIRKATDPYINILFDQLYNKTGRMFYEDMTMSWDGSNGGEITLFSAKSHMGVDATLLKMSTTGDIYIPSNGEIIGKIPAKQWVNLVCEVDTDLGVYAIYKDDTLLKKEIPLSCGTNFDTLMQWRIYMWPYGNGSKINIDKLAVYSAESMDKRTSDMINGHSYYKFADDSVAVAQANGAVAFNTYAKRILVNGERVDVAASPILDSEGYWLPQEIIEKGFGASVTEENGEIKVNSITVQAKKVNDIIYVEIEDLATNVLKLNYFYDNEGAETGFGAIGKSDFSEYKQNSYNFREISDYLIFTRPKKNEILELFNSVSKNQHPRCVLDKSQMDNMLWQMKLPGWKNDYVEDLIKTADRYVTSPEILLTKSDGIRLSDIVTIWERTIPLSLAYLHTKDDKYKNRLWQDMERMGSMSAWNPDHFLDVGGGTFGMAIAYDWLYDYWTDDQREKFETWIYNNGISYALQAEFDEWYYNISWLEPIGEDDVPLGNWAAVCQAGMIIGALAVMDKYPDEAAQVIESGLRHIEYMWPSYAPVGAWAEGPLYWGYCGYSVVSLLAALRSGLGTAFGYDEYEPLKKSSYYMMAMCGATNMFNYGDCDYSWQNTTPMSWFANAYNDVGIAEFRLNYLNKKYAEIAAYDLAFMPFVLGTDSVEKLDKDMYFKYEETGMMRSGWTSESDSYLGYHCGTNMAGHMNYDSGCFVYDIMGTRWICDLGRDGYNGNTSTYYRMRAEGNNVYVFDPDDSMGQIKETYGQGLVRRESNDEDSFAVIDITASYSNVANKAQRGFRLTDNRSVAVIKDEIELKDDKTHKFYSFLHTGTEIEIADSKTAYLKDKGKTMQVKLDTNQPLEFKVMEAYQMETSPTPDYDQKDNSKFKKLAICGEVKGDIDIMVTLTPQIGGVNFAEVQNQPMSDWTLVPSSGVAKEKQQLDGMTVNGKPYAMFSPDTENYTYFVSDASETAIEVYTNNANANVVSVNNGNGEYSFTVYQKDYPLNFRVYTVKVMSLNTGVTDATLLNPSDIIASHQPQAENAIGNIMDGDSKTRWSAQGEGVYAQYEFDKEYDISKISLKTHEGNKRQQFFDIQASTDGVNYTTVYSGNTSGTTLDNEVFTIPTTRAKFIRLVCNKCYFPATEVWSEWNSIIEFYVYGN